MPEGFKVVSAWAWRILVLGALVAVLGWLLGKLAVILIPFLVAVLLSSLLFPLVELLNRRGLPRALAVLLSLLLLATCVGALLFVVSQQLVNGFVPLYDQAIAGFREVQQWLAESPLHVSSDQVNIYVDSLTKIIQNNSSSIIDGFLYATTSIIHFAAGLFLAIFVTFFLLLDGRRIWAWATVLLSPSARRTATEAAHIGWSSLGNYVRIQVFVAFIDALGIGVGAAILGVPLAIPLGVLVFLGSFIPIVGALFTGAIAVLIALVSQGWVVALLMLAVVLFVQQAESHILQPLVMGKAVSVHPLAIILSVTSASFLFGITGALFAVPIVAVFSTVVGFFINRLRKNEAHLHDPDQHESSDGELGDAVQQPS